MIQHVDSKWVSAVKRATRAFIITFIGYNLSIWFGLQDHNATGIVDAFRDNWNAALGTAFIVALGAGGWRGLLDPLPVPTLSDTQKPPV